ncbi:hypothetical protein CBF23_010950 [Marinomonas agarivorans]|nr:hypothetical protein CBF23_010950 [Marinomonas agarivorans]
MSKLLIFPSKKSPPHCLGSWCHTQYTLSVVPNARLSIAFSGWTYVATALKQSQKIHHHLVGERYIAFGGGAEGGNMNPCCIDAITTAIKQGDLAKYDGIAYCLQEGVAGLAEALEHSFETAKAYGFKVMLSGISPFSFADEAVLLPRLLVSKHIDIFSPMLYVTGLEEENVYSVVDAIADYRFCDAAIIPTLVNQVHMSVNQAKTSEATIEQRYQDAVHYFAKKHRTLTGFLLSQ